MRGQNSWDVDGDYDRDPRHVEPIIDYQNGTPPQRARHECVWCDGPSETSGTCKTCAAIPLAERGAATARLEIESQKLTTKPVVSRIPGNVNDKEIEKEKKQ